MKKIIIIMFVFIANFFIFSQDDTPTVKAEKFEYWLKEGCPALIYNDILKGFNDSKITIYIKLNQGFAKKNSLEFYFNDFVNRNSIEINLEKKNEILDIINKYKEWNDQAIKENVKIEKEINKMKIVEISWKYLSSEDWYGSGRNDIFFKFFSQNTKHHQLLIIFPKVKSYNNEFITNRPETLYLDYNNVLILEKLLSDDYINAQLELAKADKKKADSFK